MPEGPKMTNETILHTAADVDLHRLAEQMEREWKHVQELRIESLTAALNAKEKDLQEGHEKFVKLKEDFKYNLKLLNDRDSELKKYDTVVAEIKSQLAEKDGEISELKVRIDELRVANEREVKSKEEMQGHYQRRMREKQAELEQYRMAKDKEIQKEREDLEFIKRNSERQVRELEEELDIQRQELTMGYDEAMRKREHEYRSHTDEMNSTVLAHELKVKLLQKELTQIKEKMTQMKSVEESELTAEQQRQMEKQLKNAQWEVQDITAMKDAKIHELQAKIAHEEKAAIRRQEDFKRKHDELDRVIREKENCIAKLRVTGQEREQSLEGAVRDLNIQVEDLQGALRQSQWKQEDEQKEHEATVQRLESELQDVRSRWQRHLTEFSQNTGSKDLEIENLREIENRLKTELIQRKHDIERYQKDLVAATEKQTNLERAKTQAELDWQRRCEELERNQFERSEDLVKSLAQARDDAQAEVKSVSRELKQREELILVLTRDRDSAIATLKRHGLKMEQNAQVQDETENLRQQNDNLRAVISQMRQQMETLGNEFPGKQSASSKHDSVTAEYVKNLEKEVQSLKSVNRKLETGIKDGGNITGESNEEREAMKEAERNILVKAHVERLNQIIGTLRGEKVEMVAQMRKMQTRLQHIESQADLNSKQVVTHQSETAQAQYELNAAERRHTAEVARLRQQIATLELQLRETRREADEYYKHSIQHNHELTALNHELSAIKLEQAQNRHPINFGAQELLIQQLEDEISRLRREEKGELVVDDTFPASVPPELDRRTGTTVELEKKLKQAAKHISQLAREKQQLIEVGNRLRAQIMQAGLKPASPPVRSVSMTTDSIRPPDEQNRSFLQAKLQSKLQQLESLQYQLTKQKLAQRQGVQEAWKDSSESTERTSSDKDEEPQSILKKPAKLLSPVPEDRQPVHDEPGRLSDRPLTANSEAGVATDRGGRSSREMAPVLMSMSSVGGESIQEVWRMLEQEGLSPDITPGNTLEGPFRGLQFPGENFRQPTQTQDNCNEAGNSPASSDSWTLKGRSASVNRQQSRTTNHKKYQPQKSIGKPLKSQQKIQVRNYNIKQDAQKR